MEIVVNVFAENITNAINYYVKTISVFRVVSSSDKSATLSYKENDKIIFHIDKTNEKQGLLNISLQVSNAEKLFDVIESKKLRGYGIVKGAYKFENQEITFLTAPPGNYFYTVDPFGNKIQFFDKYEERE